MLPVFSVIPEYRMDARNSSARPQSLYCMCILHSRHFKANPNTNLYSVEPYHLPIVAYNRVRA